MMKRTVALLLLFLGLLTTLMGCRNATTTQIAAVPTASPTPPPNTVGGIFYNKKTPLEVVEKPLSENKPDAMRLVGVTYTSAKGARVPGVLVLPPNTTKTSAYYLDTARSGTTQRRHATSPNDAIGKGLCKPCDRCRGAR